MYCIWRRIFLSLSYSTVLLPCFQSLFSYVLSSSLSFVAPSLIFSFPLLSGSISFVLSVVPSISFNFLPFTKVYYSMFSVSFLYLSLSASCPLSATVPSVSLLAPRFLPDICQIVLAITENKHKSRLTRILFSNCNSIFLFPAISLFASYTLHYITVIEGHR